MNSQYSQLRNTSHVTSLSKTGASNWNIIRTNWSVCILLGNYFEYLGTKTAVFSKTCRTVFVLFPIKCHFFHYVVLFELYNINVFFVNHVQKFKWLVKRLSYVKVDCCHLNGCQRINYFMLMLWNSCVVCIYWPCKKDFLCTVMKVFQKNPVVIFVFCVVHAVAWKLWWGHQLSLQIEETPSLVLWHNLVLICFVLQPLAFSQYIRQPHKKAGCSSCTEPLTASLAGGQPSILAPWYFSLHGLWRMSSLLSSQRPLMRFVFSSSRCGGSEGTSQTVQHHRYEWRHHKTQ